MAYPFVAAGSDQVRPTTTRHSSGRPVSAREAMEALPDLQRSSAGLEPYAGPWGKAEVLHLLRRTTFGPSPHDVGTLLPLGPSGAVDLLLAPQPEETSRPVVVEAGDLAPVGKTWVDQLYMAPGSTFNPMVLRTPSFKSWWTGLLLNQTLSIREKMVLFWHNHFVTGITPAGDARHSYWYAVLLYKNALGNFRDFVRQVTIDGAMLRYLNGNSNTKASPNENYARELQELFTIGKGPEAGPGDYTTYTEEDVRAAARVLTGWEEQQNDAGIVEFPNWVFVPQNHDPGDKQFSARYQNTLIRGGSGSTDGPRELNALLDMIFAQPETARFICRKLYRWFVYYAVDRTTEAQVIEPMAQLLRAGNFEIRPVLKALLTSAHFFDPVNRGCMIKNPLEYTIGLCRLFSVASPPDFLDAYAFWSFLHTHARAMDMDLADPPNVAGWPSYYQIPQYDKIWISTDTLPKRSRLASVLAGKGLSVNGTTIAVDPLAFMSVISNPADPDVLIEETAGLLHALTLTSQQKSYLKNVLIPGLPEYEWTVQWNAYRASPDNYQIRSAIAGKLQSLLLTMVSLPEFQLQ